MIRGTDHFGHQEAAGIVIDLFWTAAIFTTNSAWRRRPVSQHCERSSASHAGPTNTSPGLAGRHNGGTVDVRPIANDLHDQNTCSDNDSTL